MFDATNKVMRVGTIKRNEHQSINIELYYWCIPTKEDPEFIACMEEVLDAYELPYEPKCLVVCMDEKPYQLLGEAREPMSMIPGSDRKTDAEYTRNGIASIFAFVEPLGGGHHVSVREHRTAIDWAEEIKYLVGAMYPDAEKIILVINTLNTHKDRKSVV